MALNAKTPVPNIARKASGASNVKEAGPPVWASAEALLVAVAVEAAAALALGLALAVALAAALADI